MKFEQWLCKMEGLKHSISYGDAREIKRILADELFKNGSHVTQGRKKFINHHMLNDLMALGKRRCKKLKPARKSK